MAIYGFLALVGIVSFFIYLYFISMTNKKQLKENLFNLIASSNTSFSKIELIENFDVSPKTLKILIDQFKSQNLISEDEDNIEATQFGREYYKYFIRKK